MKPAATNIALRLGALLAAGAFAVGISGCGLEHRTTLTGVSQNDLSAGNAPYFNVGDVTYQIQVSRQLNPFATDDVQYLAGVTGAQDLTPSQLWFGVFLWAKNQTSQDQPTADTFEIEDSEGTIYQPTPLNPSINPYAWTSQTLSPDDTEPGLGTTASYGPNGGGLILFKLNQTIYSNRPLTLLIYAPGSSKPSRVSLDL